MRNPPLAASMRRPFPRFRLTIQTYARLQRWLPLPVCAMLMLLVTIESCCMSGPGKRVVLGMTLNVPGAMFFLPSVLLQACDHAMIAQIGWRLVPVILLTAVLVWETWVAAEILSRATRLSR